MKPSATHCARSRELALESGQVNAPIDDDADLVGPNVGTPTNAVYFRTVLADNKALKAGSPLDVLRSFFRCLRLGCP
jgi:hypothetical protein